LFAKSLEETDDLCQCKQLFLSIVVADDSFVLDEMFETWIGVWTRVFPGALLKDARRPVAEQFETIQNDVGGKGTHRGTEFGGTLSLKREFDLLIVCFHPYLRSFCCRKERKGKERKGKERKGKERKGKERKGKERSKEIGRLQTLFVIVVNFAINSECS